jgi:hypothetical protein
LNTATKQVKDIVTKEIKYISKLYPYSIKKFFNPELIYSHNILAFIDYNSASFSNSYFYSKTFHHKFIYLMAGIELLAVGVNLHSFNINDLMDLADNKKFTQKGEKYYTLDLLFGDIFYSRAAIYLLEYGDYLIFNSILDSLKLAHKSKLMLHQNIVETVNTNLYKDLAKNLASEIPKSRLKNYEMQIEELFEENLSLILGINSLIKTSFIIGWGLFSAREDPEIHYRLINNFVLLKAYNDLGSFFKLLPDSFYGIKQIKFIKDKKSFIKSKLDDIIATLKPEWLKSNFKALEKLYL